MYLILCLLTLAFAGALMVNRSIKPNVDAVQSITAAVKTATATGTGVDLRGYDSAMVVFSSGALVGAGLFTYSVEESNDDGGSDAYATVAAAQLDWGPQTTGVAAVPVANQIQRVGYLGAKRYIRAVATYVSGTSLVIGANVLRGLPFEAPIA